ncbi:tyrosine-protein phosphatase [Natronospora cellulosivora (SeqCode)]
MEKMIDIHSHILSVDDGAETVGEALVMLRIAQEQGVTQMVATPHYLKDSKSNRGAFIKPLEIKEEISKLQKVANKEKINIKILPGSEVYYHDQLGKDINDGLITMINGSKYFLLELPNGKIPMYLINVLYDCYHLNVKPILAHPERNLEIMDNPDILYNLLKKDWLYAQVNSSSLLGIHGKEVKKTAEFLLKKNLVQFIGSDCHDIGKRKPSLQEGLEIIKAMKLDPDYYLKNNLDLIENKEIRMKNPKRVSRSFFFKARKELAFG